jgi:hypothetical protein
VNQETVWSQERVERLKELWAGGHSASMIARELGVTRGAVIGKVSRLNLPERPTLSSLRPSPGPGMLPEKIAAQRAEKPARRNEKAAQRAVRAEKIVALHSEGMRPAAIAQALGISRDIVRGALPRRPRPPIDREKIAAEKALHAEERAQRALRNDKIAAVLAAVRVERLARRNEKRAHRDEEMARRNEKRAQIVAMRNEGMGLVEIARALGISSDIVRGALPRRAPASNQ